MSKVGRVSKRVVKALKKTIGFPRLTKAEKQKLSSDIEEIDDGRNLYFDLSSNSLSRTLYTFIKFFQIEGYKIFLKPNKRLFTSMKSDTYGRLLISEGVFKICANPAYVDRKFSLGPKEGFVEVTDRFFVESRDEQSYFVPITQHPIMYSGGYWNEEFRSTNIRLKSIFIAGNFLERRYKRIDKENNFNVINRIRIYHHLKDKEFVRLIKSQVGLHEMQNGELGIVDTQVFQIPIKDLRKVLARFYFFLAVPGVSVPFSHNIVEAMSVGSIPIIERKYAQLFKPELRDGFEAMIFDDLQSLDQKIGEAFGMDDSLIGELRTTVINYYNAHLTPHAVVKELLRDDLNKAHLLSFSSSAGHIK